eukprot:jgi/Ulvmu1/5778/UM025_0032.1
MVGEVSTPVWFRHDGDWKHGWGTLNKGQLTIWMSSMMLNPQDFTNSLLRRDITTCVTRTYKDDAPLPPRGGPQRHPRVIELRPNVDDWAESRIDDPTKQPVKIAACSATDFAKWCNAVDKFSAGADNVDGIDGAARYLRKSRLSPEPEVIALLCCRCPGFLRSFEMARHSLELESTRRTDCNMPMAVTILKSMHSNILDVEIASQQPAADGQDWDSSADPLFQIGAVKAAREWLQRMEEYLHGMVQQATTLAESELSESSSGAAALLLQDIVQELEGIAEASEDSSAANVPATFDDGHAGADAALTHMAAAASGRSTATDTAAEASADVERPRRATAPSVSSTTSTASASSAAVNGRSTTNAAALTSALTGPDPDVSESRTADRPYLNSLTYSNRSIKPILTHSILPYETYWLNTRGV